MADDLEPDDPRAGARLRRGRARVAVVAGLALVAAAAVWSLTRPDPGHRLSPGATATAFLHAQRDGDCERLIDLVSEASWSDGGRRDRGEFLDECAGAVDGYEIAVDEITVEYVEDDDDRAVARITGAVDDDGPNSHEGSLVREDGVWRVETDPNVFHIGRSVEDTVRGYLEAYNAGDCERLADHLSEAAWSQDGQLSREEHLESCADAAAAREDYGQPALGATEIDVALDEDGRGATASVALFADAPSQGLGTAYGDPDDPDTAIVVREGLEWKLQGNAERPDDRSRPPFLTLDHVELQARLPDDLAVPDEECFVYSDTTIPLEDSDDAVQGISRDFGCDVVLSVYELADDDEARGQAERIATEIVEDLPATVEELVESNEENGRESDIDALEDYVRDRRPNQAAPVPGLPDALGVRTWCDVDGCSSAVALAVRDGVLVEVEMEIGDLNGAAAVLQAQLDRLEGL